MPKTKVCKICGQEKTLDDYYINSSNGKPAARCKQCHSDSQKGKTLRPKWENGNRYETLVITELRKQGIYATSGKSSEYNYVDVVAWGCVRIEVKLGEKQLGRNLAYNFRFTPSQIENGIRADIVVLVIEGHFYVFPANHGLFYKSSGKLKVTVSYVPNSCRDNKDLLMQRHKNNWALIEQIRQGIIQDFVAGKIIGVIKPIEYVALPEQKQFEDIQLPLL